MCMIGVGVGVGGDTASHSRDKKHKSHACKHQYNKLSKLHHQGYLFRIKIIHMQWIGTVFE